MNTIYFAVRSGKKIPTDLGNRGHLKVTPANLGPIWYHTEPSEVPYSQNQFLGWDFFAISYSKTALTIKLVPFVN